MRSRARLSFGAIAILVLVATSSAWAAPATPFRTPTLDEAHAATVKTLAGKHLRYQWVACVRTDHRFRGATVVRCNVNFGIDPHVVAYCTVLRGAIAVTQFQNASIPCGPDLSGPQFTITSSGGT